MSELPTRLAYRLEPGDLARVLAAERRCACRSRCVGWAWSLATLAPVVALLVYGAGRRGGPGAALLAVWAMVDVALVIVVAREVIARRRCRAAARDLGLPRDVRVAITPEGIAQEPDADGTGRRFAWSDVAEVARRGGVTVVRLRVAGSALLIPDRAFASAADRDAFARAAAESSAGGRARAGA